MNQTEKSCKTLVETTGKAVVLAYKEPTELLEGFLRNEGFPVETIRQQDDKELRGKSLIYRVFRNHVKGWEIAAGQAKPTLIMEADFVPVIGFDGLPLPFDPDKDNAGIAWLYGCGVRMYSVSKEGFIEGGAAALVSYIVTPLAARYLLEEFVGIIERKSFGGSKYYPFDTEVDGFLISKRMKNYIAFRNYGEHGGITSREHKGKDKILWGGHHRADVLCGKLAFMPLYTGGYKHPKIKYLAERAMGWGKGILRLAAGRFLRPRILMQSHHRWRMIKCTFLRYFTLPG